MILCCQFVDLSKIFVCANFTQIDQKTELIIAYCAIWHSWAGKGLNQLLI